MSEEKRAVVKRSTDEWRSIMSRFERSGQSHREFCVAEDLAPSTFSWWRRKLGRTGSVGATVDAAVFVELADDRPAAPVWDAELELGGGVVLRVRRPGSC